MSGEIPPQEEWPEWMRRAQDGDQAAYRMVLRAIVPAIRRIVARRIFDEALVEDAVQDTLMTIHRLRHTYDPARPLMPWVAAIATSALARAMALATCTYFVVMPRPWHV